MKFVVSIFNNIKDFFDKYFVALTIILGLVFLIIGIVNSESTDWWNKFFHTVGSISLTSGIFAGIVKSNQFTEIYKKIFRDIIFGREHLEKRTDLETIWENVTHTLSNQKFSKISKEMNKNIKKYFLPLEHDYYYDNFKVEVVIEFDADNEYYIKVKEKTSFTIVCDDASLKISNKFTCMTKCDMRDISLTKYEFKKLQINNSQLNIQDVNCKSVVKKNYLTTTYEKELSGKNTYEIKREDEKIYDIRFNPIKYQIAVWIYNNISVDVTYPKDLNIVMKGLGLLDDLNVEENHTSIYNRLNVNYKGLVYKNQGIFMHLTKN